MIINNVELFKIWCHKCGYEWLSKSKCPASCAGCRQPKPWEGKKDRKSNVKMIYPIQDLQVGESITLVWQHLPNGQPDGLKNASMNRAVRQEEKRKGKKFNRMPTSTGLLVTRVI